MDKQQQKKISSAIAGLSGMWMAPEGKIKALFAKLLTAAKGENSEFRIQNSEQKKAGMFDSDGGSDEDSICPGEYRVENGVATIPIIGVLTKYPSWADEYLGLVPSELILSALDKAMADWTVERIVLLIDSPGGLVDGTNELAEAVAEYRNEKSIDAVVSDLCASGGYFIASQCEKITANAFAQIGSIGVYCVLADVSKMLEDVGVSLKLVSSGGVKGLGADGKVSQELLDDTQREVDAVYERFVAAVASGRVMDVEKVRALGDGRVWIASEAKKLGLIDEVASVDAAMTAITVEMSSMTQDQIRSYLAEHPEAVSEYREQGKKVGLAEGRAGEIQRMKEIREVCKGGPSGGARAEFAIDQFVAGNDAGSVKSNLEAIARETAAHESQLKAANDKVLAAEAEVVKLKAEQGSQPGVSTSAAAKTEAEKRAALSKEKQGEAAGKPELEKVGEEVTLESAKKVAEWQWDNEPDKRQGFSSKDRYVAIVSRELTGMHRTLKK